MAAGTVVTPDDVPRVRRDGDTADMYAAIVDPRYAEAMSHRVLRFAPGRSLPRVEAQADELLYVTAGAGILEVADGRHELRAGTAALLLAGEAWVVNVPAEGRLEIASVLVPAPPGPAASLLARDAGPLARTVVLGAQARDEATAGRQFEVLFDSRRGCRGATAFVGFVPPSGAPEHYHLYDEICVIVRGTGLLHTGGTAQPLAPGSAFHVAPRLLHSLQNTGEDDLWVLGVFRPSGSAAAAYYPDGRPAPGHDDES